jgi:hypothetical protein
MENSIEAIWKQGFLNESSLVAPKINDLYNKRSIHIIDKMKRLYRINIIIIVNMAILIPITYYFMHATWQGVAYSVMLLLTLWYSLRQNRDFKALNYGATSLDYLRSFNSLLNDRLSKSEKIFRFSYPLYFLISTSAAWSIWSSHGITQKWHQKYPDRIYIGDAPLFALIIVGVATLLILYFSDKIYRWDVRLVYGRVFDKLKETIAEMEKLKQGE